MLLYSLHGTLSKEPQRLKKINSKWKINKKKENIFEPSRISSKNFEQILWISTIYKTIFTNLKKVQKIKKNAKKCKNKCKKKM